MKLLSRLPLSDLRTLAFDAASGGRGFLCKSYLLITS